jgi:uncharacterized protein (DUF433 family)
MSLDLHPSAPPLEVDAQGVARVRGTRIPLELLVDAFADGASAEQIALRYDTLDLPDVYATLAYILRNPAGVQAYMAGRARHEDDVKRGIPASMATLRERLKARPPSAG